MNGRGRSLPHVPATAIVAAGMLLALGAGRMVASGHISVGLAVIVAAAYVPLVLLDLPAAIAVWAALLFVQHLSALSVGPSAVQALLLVGWLGTVVVRRGRLPVLEHHRRLLMAVMLLGFWLSLSTAWAEHPDRSLVAAGHWWISVLTFVVVAMSLTRMRDVRIIAVAFIVGAIVSVVLGIVGGGLQPPSSAVTGTTYEGRLTGGGGDPNEQAASFLAAMFLAVGLLSVYRRRAIRVALLLALMIITIGFFATQSRGGLLALGFATVAAFVLLPRHRGRIVAAAFVGAVGVLIWGTVRPEALTRITSFGGGGSGRSDDWTVGWRIFTGHPLVGVGLDNQIPLAPRFVLQPGALTHVVRVAETPELVHNAYLQLLAENGVIGLAAFAAVIVLVLRVMWSAVRRFEAIGRNDYANLSRAVLMGTIAMLAAIFFISDAGDDHLWMLLALGPVLRVMAGRMADSRHLAERPAVPDRPARRPHAPRLARGLSAVSPPLR